MAAGRRWLAMLLICGGVAWGRAVPWSFRADFSHGFNGWMSYPMPQDIGFDPTLSVDQGTLLRDVTSVGQASLSTGMIRPLHFLADSATRVRLRYEASWPSPQAGLKLLLAGEDGHRYEMALPASGSHEVTVTGRELQLPAAAIGIEAIVLVGRAEQPQKGAENRIALRELQVDALRPAEVAPAVPALLSDPDRTNVAAEVVDAGAGLRFELKSPARVTLTGPDGLAAERSFASGTIPLGAGARPGLWTAHVQSGDSARDFSFLVLGTIPAHPRVLLSAQRIEHLRLSASLRKQIHEQALAQMAKLKDAAAAGAQIAALPVGKTLRPSFDGELTEYFQLVEAYSNAIAFGALDYALGGGRAALESARRELLAVTRWPTWTPNRFASHGMHTYYETGIVAQRLALAYDLMAGNFSPGEKRQVADAFWSKCIEPTVDEYFRYDRMPTGASNWMANSLGGAIAAAVAVADDVPNWRTREGVALAELLAAYEHNLRGLFPGDGSEMEPAGYEHFAMQGLSWGAAALRSLGIRPAGSDRMLQGFWWPDYAMVKPGLVLDTGDFNGEFRSLSGFAFGAQFGGIPALRDFYKRVEPRGIDLLDLLCCTGGEAPRNPKGAPPLSRIFEKRGSAVLRSGWGADDTVISLRAGPWFNHEHHDQGSFQVAAFGEKLIAEAGYANYYLDPNYAGYFTQASGHNTVLLDGDAFSQGEYDGNQWKALRQHPLIVDRLLSPNFDYVAADLAAAYGGRVSRYRRQFLFISPDVLIVRDDLQAQQPHVFTWLLHPAENAAVKSQGAGAQVTVGEAQAEIRAEGAAAWEIRPAPLPAAISQYLGNVLLHPGEERKIPTRQVLRLSSERSNLASFEVKMRFHRSGAAPAGPDGWSVFRDGSSELHSHGLTTDGALLAGRGGDDWVAIGAHSVRRGGAVLFTAREAVNAAWAHLSDGILIDLQLAGQSPIAIRAPGDVTTVSVDGAPVRYSEQGGLVRLPSMAQGGHRVRISTRAAVQ